MLSGEDLRRFAEDGYLVVPGVVPGDRLVALDAEIDALIAADPPARMRHGSGPARRRGRGPRRHAAGEVRSTRVPAARSIALNIPPFVHKPGGPHIDGHGAGQDPPRSFTMLAGVYLVDEPEGMSGNLWVWPGSHLVHQRLFRERGTRALAGVGGHALSLDLPPALGPRREVTARRGDLLLAHFLLGHNTSDRVRRIAYYRLSCPGHAARWEQTFLEYQRVRNA